MIGEIVHEILKENPSWGSEIHQGYQGGLDPDVNNGGFDAGNGFQTNVYEESKTMKKSELIQLIKECVSEIVSENNDWDSKHDELLKENVDSFETLESKLKSHDWGFEYSDDHSYWKKGQEEEKELVRLSKELSKIDAKRVAELWNRIQPKDQTKKDEFSFIEKSKPVATGRMPKKVTMSDVMKAKKDPRFSGMSAEEIAHELRYGGLDESHSESDMSNPEEKREVQIGKEILERATSIELNTEFGDGGESIDKIIDLANELIKMHSEKPKKPFNSPFKGWGKSSSDSNV